MPHRWTLIETSLGRKHTKRKAWNLTGNSSNDTNVNSSSFSSRTPGVLGAECAEPRGFVLLSVELAKAMEADAVERAYRKSHECSLS